MSFALPSELWLHVLQQTDDAVAGAALIAALGPRLLAHDESDPCWRAWALRRWNTCPRSVPQSWRRYYAARLARERALPRIFYVAVCADGGRVQAEANLAPGPYPARFRAFCATQSLGGSGETGRWARWETHTSRELGEAHELALKRARHAVDGLPCTRDYQALLFCSLSVGEGDGRQRLGCIVAHFAGGDWRREAEAHAEAFLRTMNERFLYQLHASRLPPLPVLAPAVPPPQPSAQQQPPPPPPQQQQQQRPGDALAHALRELAVEPAGAATAGRVELDIEYALELELDAWHRRKGVPYLPPRPSAVPVSARVEVARARAEARATGLLPPPPPPPPTSTASATSLRAGIEQLSLAQSQLLQQMQHMAARQAELATAVHGTRTR